MKQVTKSKQPAITGAVLFMTAFFLFFISACDPTAEYVAWVVGDCDENGKAMLLYSDDSGNTWNRQASDILPDNVSLTNIYAVNKNTVWVIGEQGVMLQTVNGGALWERIISDDLDENMAFHTISRYQGDIWISGYSGLIMRSSDNGNTWTVFDDSMIDNFEKVQEFLIQGICAVNQDIIYAVGNKSTPPCGIVLRTVDGGQNWEDIDMPNKYNQNGWIGVKATDPDHVIIYGGRGHFIVTADGGKEWVTGGPLSTRDINDLVMVSSTDYWAACDYDSIIRTSDSGISWKDQPSAGASNSFLVGIDTLDGRSAPVSYTHLTLPTKRIV